MAGEERRLQILRVAVTLFSQKGFRGTTTKEIANLAGVSEAMVFRHFANKQELYAAILDHKASSGDTLNPEQIVAEAIAEKNDRAVFERLAVAALEHHESDQEFQRLLMYSALEGHELADMFFEKFVKRVYELLGGYVSERQREGAIAPGEPALMVRAFIGMIIHHSISNNLWDPKRRLLDISNAEAAKSFTDILFNGIGQPIQPENNGRRAAGVARKRSN